MRRPRRDYRSDRPLGPKKAIKANADYQLDWSSRIPSLRRYEIETVNFLTIPGMAPKDFITDSEYRLGHRTKRQRSESYIAKVGSKFYPNESITEHLVTRIGQTYGLNIAESKLRIVNEQVRFMSKYFLDRRTQQLTHGAEIYALSLGKVNYREIAEKRAESEYFTFQMTVEAIKDAFVDFDESIISGFVEMLTFDALIGHNDRHPYNWGVIVPLRKHGAPRFSPIFDTARALFWNLPEKQIGQILNNQSQLEAYIMRCSPPIGWDKEPPVDFFRLIGLIWRHYKGRRKNVVKLLRNEPLSRSLEMIDREFAPLMSSERRELINRCLQARQKYLQQAVRHFEDEEERDAS